MTDHSSSPPASAGREEEREMRARSKAMLADLEDREPETLTDDERVQMIRHRLAIGYYWAGTQARPDVEWLLDRLEASRSESARLREAVDRLRSAWDAYSDVATTADGHIEDCRMGNDCTCGLNTLEAATGEHHPDGR